MNIENKIKEYLAIKDKPASQVVDKRQIIDLELKKYKSDIINEICNYTISIIKDQIQIANKYDVPHHYDSDIEEHYYFQRFEMYSDGIGIDAIDTWNRYTYDINISFKDIISYNKNDYIKECIHIRMSMNKSQIEFHKAEIDKLQLKLTELEKELETINQEK